VTRYLLDVNVVLALVDENHWHHAVARRWAKTTQPAAWLLCPIVENAVLRILSTPAYTGFVGGVASALELLEQFRAMPQVSFQPDTVSFAGDAIPLATLDRVTPKHLADLHLLGLARAAGARFATFDRRILIEAAPFAHEHLEILPT
jgi:toxin-antitoxin system PIN domain toxin